MCQGVSEWVLDCFCLQHQDTHFFVLETCFSEDGKHGAIRGAFLLQQGGSLYYTGNLRHATLDTTAQHVEEMCELKILRSPNPREWRRSRTLSPYVQQVSHSRYIGSRAVIVGIIILGRTHQGKSSQQGRSEGHRTNITKCLRLFFYTCCYMFAQVSEVYRSRPLNAHAGAISSLQSNDYIE